ncbi:MAG: hypothetical protein DMG61_04695 [Acidobacteria bacterium]|nr:MAG: hypothetical protein DMG61_04695 [Acidobacteriota bacterium]PYY19988.1 MAG: hypothetical protein DMG60_02090 [Acidobacteriota bacterium]
MAADRIVLSVKASIAIRKNDENDLTDCFELLFDSRAQALPPGARASVVSGRQLLYRIGSVYVDMQIDKNSDSERASLVGQILDSARPGHPAAGIPVALQGRGGNIARTMSNDNGEFRLEFDVRNDLKLSLAMDRRHPVYLPITNIELESESGSAGKRQKASAATHSLAQHR